METEAEFESFIKEVDAAILRASKDLPEMTQDEMNMELFYRLMEANDVQPPEDFTQEEKVIIDDAVKDLATINREEIYWISVNESLKRTRKKI